MFELVIKNGDVETPVFVAESAYDIELLRQRHIRSYGTGVAEVREIKEKKTKEKAK